MTNDADINALLIPLDLSRQSSEVPTYHNLEKEK